MKNKEIKGNEKDLGRLPDGISYELYQKMWEQLLKGSAIKTSKRIIRIIHKNVNKNKNNLLL